LGKVQGNTTGDGCNESILEFMSIIRTRHGHLDYSATRSARRQFLDECSGSFSSNYGCRTIASSCRCAAHCATLRAIVLGAGGNEGAPGCRVGEASEKPISWRQHYVSGSLIADEFGR
jgi:hypothetical protein